ncbi:transposase [Alteromonas macleodii]|tara:strand:+ start:4166 stop:5107 length:942 start_codon:yes stop_codon:yes gene_type:complete
MPISDKLIDQLLAGCDSREDIIGEAGLLKQLTKKVAERALNSEMEQHLSYAKHAPEGKNSGNSRNGKSSKKVRSVHGEIDLDIPRDRNGSFEPQLVKKGDKQLNGFNDRIILLYARGMTTRNIQAHLEESYGVEVSPTFISQVTNEMMDEVKQWQQRPLDALYPVVYLDCLVVRSRDSSVVQNKSAYLALGINSEGEKELLGLCMAQTEGAKFWLSVMNELKNRGVEDIFIACCDGLKGFPEAIEAVYPKTQVQLCVVQQIRQSLRYVNWKQRKIIAADLKLIYGAATRAEAEQALELFAEKWDCEHPTISRS